MAVSSVACGPGGVDGVTYAQVGGQLVGCGTDSKGNALYLHVWHLDPTDEPLIGGETAGLMVGGAVFLALSVAFAMRALRRFLESSSES